MYASELQVQQYSCKRFVWKILFHLKISTLYRYWVFGFPTYMDCKGGSLCKGDIHLPPVPMHVHTDCVLHFVRVVWKWCNWIGNVRESGYLTITRHTLTHLLWCVFTQPNVLRSLFPVFKLKNGKTSSLTGSTKFHRHSKARIYNVAETVEK